MLSQLRRSIVGIHTRLFIDALLNTLLLIYLIYFTLAFLDSTQICKLIAYAKQLAKHTQHIEKVQKEHDVKLNILLKTQQSKESNNTWKKSQFYEINRCVVLYMLLE